MSGPSALFAASTEPTVKVCAVSRCGSIGRIVSTDKDDVALIVRAAQLMFMRK
jgi:hypothetical protein